MNSQARGKWIPFLALFAIVIAVPCAQAAQATKPFSFAIVPQQSAATLARAWRPVLDVLSQRTGHPLKFATATDIPTFEQRLLEGEYDFAYMNPYHYTIMHDRSGYMALAHARDKRIKGIITVRKDASLNSLSDLAGLTLAFPAPASFAATVLPQAELRAQGIDFEPQYVSSHDSVYLAVSSGIYPAGGGVKRTLKSTAAAVSEQLRVLWVTKGYTPHAIAVHPRVPAEVVKAIQATLDTLHESDSGLAALSPLSLSGFQIAVDTDWDDVRALNLGIPVGRAKD